MLFAAVIVVVAVIIVAAPPVTRLRPASGEGRGGNSAGGDEMPARCAE
jgi:hypothetical protein